MYRFVVHLGGTRGHWGRRVFCATPVACGHLLRHMLPGMPGSSRIGVQTWRPPPK